MAEMRRRPAPKGSRRQFNRTASPTEADSEETLIFGMHAVEAALSNPARTIITARMTANAARKLAEPLRQRGLEPDTVTPRDLDRLLGSDTVHQGALVQCEPLAVPELEVLITATTATRRPIIVLDQITDPHNVGAILRSGAAFGCSGLIMTRRHSPPLSGVLAKSASGGLEQVPVHLATNLARALTALKEAGVVTLGLDGSAPEPLHAALPENEPIAIVLGAEGKGLRQLTAQTCDRLCRIETAGAFTSLNVSNAAAIALHLISMRRACEP